MKKIVLIAAILVFSALSLQAQWGSFNGIITTSAVTGIQTTSATANASFTLTSGDDPVYTRGFVWNTAGNPSTTVNDGSISETEDGPWSGTNQHTYNLSLSSLSANQVYYVKAYVANDDGDVAYGNQVAFATIPTLGEWGLIALGSLFAIGGGWFVWRRMVL